jgi:hypothetical protein
MKIYFPSFVINWENKHFLSVESGVWSVEFK